VIQPWSILARLNLWRFDQDLPLTPMHRMRMQTPCTFEHVEVTGPSLYPKVSCHDACQMNYNFSA
jgi:hypothetical protein